MKVGRQKRKKNIMPFVVLLLVLLSISLLFFVIRISIRNNVFYENIKRTDKITNTELNEANIVLMNNVIMGAEHNGKWSSASDIADMMQSKKNIGVMMYSETAMLGTYKTASIKYNKDSNLLYTTTTRVPSPDKYIAVTESEATRTSYMKETKITDKDRSDVKKALGKYRLLNPTVNIIKVYEVYINPNVSRKSYLRYVKQKHKFWGIQCRYLCRGWRC